MFCSEHLPLGVFSKPGRVEVKPQPLTVRETLGKEKGPVASPLPANCNIAVSPCHVINIHRAFPLSLQLVAEGKEDASEA